ncbi:MAG: ligase-associated DNA damage response DEXH box helicase [Oscillatoriales cyanobacterium RM1_1_9]|nr:ligase-associated DNA damage response DEXH box helicase [Oscillatoriales cyanobacterium SM2_3_0]NJO47545.1 ligase-associated DNA damage response DEXH box helicase [Oscillatoriales cyanobacterium RM2_1_1]NJO70806.1 ligase-associated DNA damage response DEXH box helicase [Oscillatoriales cyanobacterium RM1_1_9]
MSSNPLEPILDWFTRQYWQPLSFQVQTWEAYLQGKSGLIQVPTGSGKTYGAVMGPIARMLQAAGSGGNGSNSGLRLLYITPLRALSRDIEAAIRRPIQEMGWSLRVESRTGDTRSSVKARQLKKLPEILITTPESLSVMLSYTDTAKRFSTLQTVILDEWHELLSTKRGTQTELCLAHLRQIQPQLQTWAISATLGNVEEAAQTAVGMGCNPVIIQSTLNRQTQIRSILPESVDSFPWAGHLGLRMFESLVEALEIEVSTLIFTNTRSQSERWYQALTFALPEHHDRIALHHGSIAVQERQEIEAGVKTGAIKWVVCTSSLDLGVDFQPVERVVQIGSAKNLARLLQRAGRSAHVPGGTAEILFLPTNALELLEISAFRRGLEAGAIESRYPLDKPYDVLVQHFVTLACGDGFSAENALKTIKSTIAYQKLTPGELDWILHFLEKGGQCLGAYPNYQKLKLTEGIYRISTPQLARMHRLNIGTITSNSALNLVYTNRQRIGIVEESFVSKLKKGDVFFFGGRQLEFVMVKDMVVYVRNTRRTSTVTPIWGGGKLAISDTLSHHLRQEIDRAVSSSELNRELTCIQPILQAQSRISHLPKSTELLIETCKTREGQHLYVYPFAGRFVHEGLGFLWGYYFAAQKTATFTISANDYGYEILGPKDYPFQSLFSPDFFNPENLTEQIKTGLNISELTQRRFREIAQVAGLVFKGYPSSRKTSGQLQVSSSLLYEVFAQYEPGNLLLQQAEQEVIQQQLEAHRLGKTLRQMNQLSLIWKNPNRPSSFAFPLLIERLSSRLSNESLLERIERLKQQWEDQS